MNPKPVKTQCFKIGDMELDTGTASVHRASTPVDLPKLSFDLLLCLARHAPNVVDTDILMQEVWGKVVIGEETVKQRVKLLRQSLGDNSVEPKYIASIRGRGYRLIAPVTPLLERTTVKSRKRTVLRRSLATLITLIFLMAFGLLIRNIDLEEPVVTQVIEPEAPDNRIAVLPFNNFSGLEENEYLADGITEDTISALARIDGLGVIARTTMMRFKDSDLRVKDIARELNAGTLVEGSVQRSGEDLRITVQMIDANTEEHYWAQTFEVSLARLPEMQQTVASRVAASLQATISKAGIETLQQGSTQNSAAYDAYLKGRLHYRRWNQQDNETALAFYQQAIELDPGFALALAGIANTYALRASMYGAGDEWAKKAITQAEAALSINPLLPEAYKALGISSFHFGHFQKSLNYYLKAIELNPVYDEALFNIAEIYHLKGQWDEAVRYQLRDSERAFGADILAVYLRDLQFYREADEQRARASLELPVSFISEESLSLHDLLARDLDGARVHSERMLRSFPGFALSPQRAGEIELAAGNWELAQDYMEQAAALSGPLQTYPSLRLAEMLSGRGQNEAASALMDMAESAALQSMAEGHEAWFFPWSMAFIEALRGNNDQAVSWYEKAVEAGRRRYEWDEQEPVFDSLRNDQRFLAALEIQRQQRQGMRERVARLLITD